MAGRILIFLLLGLACAVAGCSDSGGGGRDEPPGPAAEAEAEPPAPRPRVVQALPPGAEGRTGPPDAPAVAEPRVLPEDEQKPADIAATDAQLERELAALRRAPTEAGGRAVLQPDGTASPPIEAPAPVQEVIHAGNLISNSPYKWGGGHGRWLDDGYDCSGSVSFALFAGGMLDAPLNSSGFLNWGEPGPGRWITIYTNPGHMYMVVAGLRFDTSGRTRLGSRWQPDMRSPAGFVARHPPGL